MFGDVQLYSEILYTFYTDYIDVYKSLESMFQEEDDADLILEVHTIKGLAATIGAKDLHVSALNFEQKLRDKLFDFDAFSEFVEDFQAVLENLKKYFQSNPFKKIKR